jgi:hypothetical protein
MAQSMIQINRENLQRPMKKTVESLFNKFNDRFIEYMKKDKTIIPKAYLFSVQRHAHLKVNDEQRKFWEGLFAHVKQEIQTDAHKFIPSVQKEFVSTFNAVGNFSIRKLGLKVPKKVKSSNGFIKAEGDVRLQKDFQLTNPELLNQLRARAATFPETSMVYFDDAIDLISKSFLDAGNHPIDSAFLDDLQQKLEYQAKWQAERFARTETGIIQNSAQYETYKRNHVRMLEWSPAWGGNRRDNHQEMRGVRVETGKNFELPGIDGGVYHIPYPQHHSLPAEEVINCACDTLPIVLTKKPTNQVWLGGSYPEGVSFTGNLMDVVRQVAPTIRIPKTSIGEIGKTKLTDEQINKLADKQGDAIMKRPHEYSTVWDEKGNPIFKEHTSNASDYVIYTSKQAQQMFERGSFGIHNHPIEMSFSDTDILTQMELSIDREFVRGKSGGRYKMTIVDYNNTWVKQFDRKWQNDHPGTYYPLKAKFKKKIEKEIVISKARMPSGMTNAQKNAWIWDDIWKRVAKDFGMKYESDLSEVSFAYGN